MQVRPVGRWKKRSYREILLTARKFNSEADISGLLLYAEGNFLQILEGDEERVNTLYAKIEMDHRHTGLIRLMEFHSNERNFPDWTMGYKRLSRQEMESSIPGYSDFFKGKEISQKMKDRVNAAIWTMLMSFRKIVNA